MRILLLIIASMFSGIFAGMGMGGGTFLIPILSLFFGVPQLICQSTNVICFLILAIFCFIVYVKNKLIDFKIVLCVIFPSVTLSTLASIFAIKVTSNFLQICFSIFIILVGIFYFFKIVFKIKNDKIIAQKHNKKFLKTE